VSKRRIRRLRASYEDMVGGDDGAATRLLTPRAAWHVPGHSQVAGTYVGPAAVAGYLRQLRELTDGTLNIQVQDVTVQSGSLLVWQRASATRDGTKLDIDECVILKLHGERVGQAWLSPADQAAHDQFWGGESRPTFSLGDRNALTAAVAQASPSGRTTGASLAAALVVAMVAASIAVFAYDVLNHVRPRARVVASTQSAADIDHITFSGGSDQVRWNVASALVRSLAVDAPENGTVDIVLPLPATACAPVAAAGNGTCEGGVAKVATPLRIDWKDAQALASSAASPETGLDLTFSRSGDEVGLTMLATGTAAPVLCFSPPSGATDLTVNGTNQPFTFTFTQAAGGASCSGLHVVAGGQGAGTPQAPVVTLGGIDALFLQADGPRMTAQGFTGHLVLTPGGTQSFDSPTDLSMRAGPKTVQASLAVTGGTQPLRLTSDGATSVIGGEQELVPAVWDRYSGIVLPLFGGFVSVFVIAPLAVVVQGVTGLIAGWSGPASGLDWLRRRLPGRSRAG
jgi:uncharacterized protein